MSNVEITLSSVTIKAARALNGGLTRVTNAVADLTAGVAKDFAPVGAAEVPKSVWLAYYKGLKEAVLGEKPKGAAGEVWEKRHAVFRVQVNKARNDSGINFAGRTKPEKPKAEKPEAGESDDVAGVPLSNDPTIIAIARALSGDDKADLRAAVLYFIGDDQRAIGLVAAYQTAMTKQDKARPAIRAKKAA